ncbi:MAG TPA: cobyrinate a,c-diamide synthase [Acidimicrobiales bacterium]|nr:cobyrinate a,c-diamide synthase [Acidimicrobiales bacterium]
MTRLGPRLVVAGTASGTGKTTVATGLLAALTARGMKPAGAKVGPDFIDPGYHALACRRPPRNLDPWLCGPEAVAPLAGRAGDGADVLVVEGVMGLFDGASDGTASSTADVARLLDAPVVLVVDASAMSASVAAMVHGYATFDPGVRVAGVILNQVGSEGHETLLREALAPSGVEVLGALSRNDAMRWRDRHLGLVPVAERPAETAEALDRLAALVAEQVDLEAVLRLARSAPSRNTGPVALPTPGPEFTVGVAGGAAFTFTYTDTLDALRAAGGTIVTFDPLQDPRLPGGLDGLIVGGGFPEVHAGALAGNRPLLDDLAAAVRSGLPTWAECGGLLLLADELDGHPMAGVVPARASMTGRLTLGYRTATTRTATPLGPPGTVLRGHEFHYSSAEPAGAALQLASRWGSRREGHATVDLLATYLHHHPGGDPGPVGAFAARCALRRALHSA